MKDVYLKSMPVGSVTKESCLKHLLALINACESVDLIRILSRMGKVLHSGNDIYEAQTVLLKEYATEKMQMELEKDRSDGTPSLLFHRFAVTLIDELLRIHPVPTDISALYEQQNAYVERRSLLIPIKVFGKNYLPLEGIFLLANTLIGYLESESPNKSAEEYSAQAKIFYSRLDIDQAIAIGRNKVYNRVGLQTKLNTIGIDIEDYTQAITALCAHVEAQPYIELELPKSIDGLSQTHQKNIFNYLPRLTKQVQSERWDFATIYARLSDLYFTDFLCRQHPLLELNQRYFCLQPRLLWAAFMDLPYYLLVASCNGDQSEIKSLGAILGAAFEDHFKGLCNRVFSCNQCNDYICKNKYPKLNLTQKGHRIGDSLVTYEKNEALILEFKVASPAISIKLGGRVEARKKFIELEGNKGVSQLVRDAMAYRLDSSFNGVIYIALVCRGPIPRTSDFDDDLRDYLQGSSEYQTHLRDPQNKPLIFLDALAFEFLLSTIRQNVPCGEILNRLAGLPPSKVIPTIGEIMDEYNCNKSAYCLYKEEIENFGQSGTAKV